MSEEFSKALNAAKTKEEKEAVINKYKEEVAKLTDEELFVVAGGVIFNEEIGGGYRTHRK